MKKRSAIILGATGSCGKELVYSLIKNPNFDRVTIFTRNELKIRNRKLVNHSIDFSKLQEYKKLIVGDILFSALGTTLKEAGSKSNQYEVDFTYQYEFAKMASQNGVSSYSLISSAGANEKSLFFYPRIKGELEIAVTDLSFEIIRIFQPPLLIRQPDLIRPAELIGIKLFSALNKIGIFKQQKPLSVFDLAKIMTKESISYNEERIIKYTPKELHNLV